jgi:ATP-dependent Lhr-like helicase
MTTSPASSSDAGSRAFDLLHEEIRRWIWRQGWTELRDIQERSIPVIVAGDRDVILIAATASGKTEAAFLPILSRIVGDAAPGFKALYVSPLKALINDQFRRLDELCETLEVPVWRWHGDVSASVKRRARDHPGGVVLITPESLEGVLVRRGPEVSGLFGNLRYIVIDEFHAFLHSERGIQLRSLLRRLEHAIGRVVPRVALSATLGEPDLVKPFLRSEQPDRVTVLESNSAGTELKLQVRGYVVKQPDDDGSEKTGKVEAELSVDAEIARHLFERLRGTSNLVFAGSRKNVEVFADRLREICETNRLPNEFFPHHGSLSRELREELEARLKEGQLPTTAIATTTLELGIDIGDVESVAQIGPARSVSALRQRLGRSGRRKGKPAILRAYVREYESDVNSRPADLLRFRLVQTIAVVNLLLRSWFEPPPTAGFHLSTLVHQILAAIAQHGGLSAAALHGLLMRDGPFDGVPRPVFVDLLRRLGDPDVSLIEQALDGMLMLGRVGERIVEHYSFFAVFQSPEEYRVVTSGKTLGTLPVDFPLIVGAMIIFAGRRWLIDRVDPSGKIIEVEPAKSGVPPPFSDKGIETLHPTIAKEMRDVLMGSDIPSYLNDQAAALLLEGRAAFTRLGLAERNAVELDGRVYLFPWTGSVELGSFAFTLRARGQSVLVDDVYIELSKSTLAGTIPILQAIATNGAPDALALAALAADKISEKFDEYLDDDLLTANYASQRISAREVPAIARSLLAGLRNAR